MKAKLIEDRGAATSGESDFFRCPEFLEAEGTTHSLVIEAGGLGVCAALPLLVREIPGSDGLADAISPYGYPGGAIAGEPIDPALVDWADAGLVSAFIREAPERAVFSTAASRGVLQIADPHRASGLRSRLQEQIRAGERAGIKIRRHERPGGDERAAFHAAYTETMERTGATERYYFSHEYFEHVLAAESAELFLAEARGEAAAGAIAVRSSGLLHYYLGGTLDRHLEISPMKNLFQAMMDRSAELKIPLNLGGGLEAGDGLERFKRGFANSEVPFRTSELVFEPAAYDELSPADPPEGFFPAYRASLT